ncbi:hypothetical protein EFA69_08660 [Rufibacter immobilis]|uniref:Uncharacterized protein n=1 Tax=Rufibacter immobilis TaxID=1348778 RepID=A0A3M9MVS0_9BACT|nr:hypothetical protein [Rufibacter immobilis]RNI29619.1 hypothetical protein EFA69_08660 [Rufibacter immobilis]
MELEEMERAWGDLSKRIEKQEQRIDSAVNTMIQQKYRSRLDKIRYAESIGTFICYAGAAYVSLNLTKIEGVMMQLAAALSIMLLLLLPVISLQSVRAIKSADILSKTYLEAIQDFSKQKIKFQQLQKINVCLGLVLMLLALPVLAAIQGKSLTQIPYFLTLIFPLLVVFVLVFAFWVLRHYNKVLREAERMLDETNPVSSF